MAGHSQLAIPLLRRRQNAIHPVRQRGLGAVYAHCWRRDYRLQPQRQPDGDDDTTLIIIPTQAHDAVKDPAGTEWKPNVITPWLDLMTDAGFHVILMHGYYNDDLNRLVALANDGIDGFAAMDNRIAAVMDDAYEKGLYKDGRVVLAGSSRHGFAVLHAHANLPKSAAAIAIGPVMWWPRLKEFHGMDDHPIITKNSLFELAFKMPPRPVLVQIAVTTKGLVKT